MKRVCLGLLVVVATAGTSAAGTYLGLGIGTAPAFSGGDQLESSSRSGRVLLGTRFGNVSVEAAVGGYDMAIRANSGVVDPYGKVYQASGALKLSLPLGNNFEAFGRIGAHHTWLRADDDRFSVSGNGLLAGAGIEYRLNLILGQGSIFLDYQYNQAKLSGERFVDRNALDTNSRMFTIGLTVGL